MPERENTENVFRKYNELLHVGKHLSQEIPTIYGLDEGLARIIRVLGIGQGKNFVLAHEEEVNFLIDFYLHEPLSNGSNSQTMLERYRSDHPNLAQREIAYLDAAKASYTSLFKVIDVNPRVNTITVVDLLSTSQQPLSVINMNLSRTATSNHIIFSRLLPCQQFNAFSGMFAGFNESSDRALLKRYKAMKNRVKSEHESVKRFVACFKLNRVLGITILTR